MQNELNDSDLNEFHGDLFHINTCLNTLMMTMKYLHHYRLFFLFCYYSDTETESCQQSEDKNNERSNDKMAMKENKPLISNNTDNKDDTNLAKDELPKVIYYLTMLLEIFNMFNHVGSSTGMA